jgi:SAM-dependent methyltransferase
MKSLLYWHPVIYERVLGIVHGSFLASRYRMIAKEVGIKKRVFDVGCGTGMLAGFLDESCRYAGWDANKKFVTYCKANGLVVEEHDIFDFANYPKSDVIVLCDILHHVCPKDKELLEGALKKARRLIAVEPLKPYRIPLPKPALKVYDAVLGDHDGVNSFENRIGWNYSEAGLNEYFSSFGRCTTRKIGLDVLAVFNK